MSRQIIILALAVVLNATANILIKAGMRKLGGTSMDLRLLGKAALEPALWAGILSFAMALAAYSLVLSRLNLSVAYPIMVSMGLIIVVLVSYFVFREVITPLQIAGFVFIIAGVWMVAR